VAGIIAKETYAMRKQHQHTLAHDLIDAMRPAPTAPPPPAPPSPRGAPSPPPDRYLAVAQLDPRGQFPSRQSPADEGWFSDLLAARTFLRPRGGGTIYSARADKIVETVDPQESGGLVHTLADAQPEPEYEDL
jgi:hypothetical protein